MNPHENEPMIAHDSWADYYDCVYKLTYGARYQQFTDQTLGVIRPMVAPPARVVDFGAGTGRLAIPLAQIGYHVTAVEASAEMCRVWRAKAAAGAEGAVAAPCVVCQRSSVPTEQRRPVEVAVFNQSICEPLPDSGFDLGLCVFTVLNYSVEEMKIRQFASVAASAIHPGGKLLVSFVEKMAPMMGFFNARPKSDKSLDGRCSAVRNINIRPLQETLYECDEESALTKDGRPVSITAESTLSDETARQFAELDEEWANTVGFVAEESRAEIREYLAERPKPKGHYLQIQAGSRRLDVFLFAAEGTGLYLKLFAKRGAAPRILCIKNWGHIGGEWMPFGNWQAHLGKAMQAGRVTPELLVAREGDHDWPWPVQVERFEDWDDRPMVMWRKEGDH